MNVGWYVVYLLMIVINQVMCVTHGFNLFTWQAWVWMVIPIMCFVAGAHYKEDT